MAFGSGNNSTSSVKSHGYNASSNQNAVSSPQQNSQCNNNSSVVSPSNSSGPLATPKYYDGGGSSSAGAGGHHHHYPYYGRSRGVLFSDGAGGDYTGQYNQFNASGGGNMSVGGSGGGGGPGGGGGSGGGPSRDLNASERQLLDQIRARKAELLSEIAQLQDEIDNVSRELLFKEDEVKGPVHSHVDNNVPLADIEVDNLSECGEDKPPNTVTLGSNSSTSSNSSKEKDRLKLMSLGCKKFNMDPKKGIEFLIENGLLKKDDEQDFALFLYRGEGLNKTAIGDYLGEYSPFNERVLKAFVCLHDFTDLILVQALRQFLWSFRLPGEAQKIDRMMECFAQRYCQNNPDIFSNTDTCYILSFAIIMLNTSLHNPSVKDKPTVDTFISMNRGIDKGGDVPRELLISLYNSIQSEPFKIPEDDGNDLMHTFFNPDKEGWLWKQGGRYKTWKRRWFILNDNCLYYFEFTTDKEPRGIIPLENVNVREIEDSGGSKAKQKYCFELYATDGSEVIKACKTDSDGRVVEGRHKFYRLSAASEDERASWVKALKQSISYSPFYEILRKGASGTSLRLRE